MGPAGKMVHGKGSKGKILEEKQLKRYRRSLKRTRAKSRNPSVEENERRPAAGGGGEKVDGRRPSKPPTSPSSSGDTRTSNQEGPRPAKTPVNELKPPAVNVIVSQEEEEEVEQTIPLLSTDTTTSDQEICALETASTTEVKAPVSVIVTGEAEDLEKTVEQGLKPSVDVIVTQAEGDQKTTIHSSTSDNPINQEELTKSARAVQTAEPIKVIVTQEEEEESLRKTKEEEIVRLEELAAKAKALATWKRAVSPARKPVVVKEEKSNKSEDAAAVEEAEEIVASDNLKVIDSAAEVLAGGKAAEENSETAAPDVKDGKLAIGSNKTEETTASKEEFNFEESLGWTVQGRKGRKSKKGLSKLKGIISELKAEEAEKKDLPEEPKVLSFEEAAKQVEAESAFARRTFAASEVIKVQQEDADTDSSGWEVIEVSDESEDEVKEVTEEVTKERMSEEENGNSQRWVEEMNEKNRKKMELENKSS